jgi:hypothetical protein
MRSLDMWSAAAAASLILLTASCQGGGNELTVTAKEAGMENQALSVQDAYFTTAPYSKTFSDGSSKSAAQYRVYLSDGPINGVEAAEGKALVSIWITGPAGSETDAALPAGTYPAETDGFSKEGGFNKTGALRIDPPKGGSAKKVDFHDFSGGGGKVEITKSTVDELVGTVELTRGEIAVKGAFTAKKRDR